MKRFASTRSEVFASHPIAGIAQCSVGSIDEDGIRYGFTTHALIASTIATAPAIVTTQSIATRHPCGRLGKRRSIGLWDFFAGGRGGRKPSLVVSYRARRSGSCKTSYASRTERQA